MERTQKWAVGSPEVLSFSTSLSGEVGIQEGGEDEKGSVRASVLSPWAQIKGWISPSLNEGCSSSFKEKESLRSVRKECGQLLRDSQVWVSVFYIQPALICSY